MAQVKDVFAQFFRLIVTQTAANTISFSSELGFGLPVLTNQVIVLHKLIYGIPAAEVAKLTANGDEIQLGLCNSNSISSLAFNLSELYDRCTVSTHLGAAGQFILNTDIVHDFSGLPGGGLLIPATSVYLGADSTGLATAGTFELRGLFTFKTLKANEYLELAQRLKVLT